MSEPSCNGSQQESRKLTGDDAGETPMTKAPKELAPRFIYLQDGENDEGETESSGDYDGVSWCQDPINNGDTKYIRYDIYERELNAKSQELEEARKGWIPVGERLPEIGERVFISVWAHNRPGTERIQMLGHIGKPHDFGEWWQEGDFLGETETYTPTHWMPLPKPPAIDSALHQQARER